MAGYLLYLLGGGGLLVFIYFIMPVLIIAAIFLGGCYLLAWALYGNNSPFKIK